MFGKNTSVKLLTLLGFALVMLYIGFAVIPFYTLGIHEHPFEEIYQGRYDPSHLAFYQFSFWLVLGTYLLVPISVGLLYQTIQRWQRLDNTIRFLTTSTLMLSFFTLVFLFSSTGYSVTTWMLD